MHAAFLTFVRTLSASQRRYALAIVTSGLALVAWVTPYRSTESGEGLMQVALILWGLAIATDAIQLYNRLYSLTVGKAVVWLSGAVATNFLLADAGNVINQITHEDPSKFPHSVTLVSILNAPLLVSGVLTIVLLLWVAIGPVVALGLTTPEFKMLWHDVEPSKSKPERFHGWSTVIRFFGAGILLVTLIAVSQDRSTTYALWVQSWAGNFLYEEEMYANSRCKLPTGARVAFLGDSRILIGTRVEQSLVFNASSCAAG